jgi:hypothetical protein
MTTKTKTTKQYDRAYVHFGCDPEFFFRKDGKIIGSEKILPLNGLDASNTWNKNTKIVRDGIQAEMNPYQSHCRELLRGNIEASFITLNKLLKEKPGVSLDFSQNVDITQEEMDSLSHQSKVFGCNPSRNLYDKNAIIPVKDPSKFLSRCAGGHIHLGNLECKAKELIPILDILVGNTCVMIDRDESNIERRKVYGRAGEYRDHDKHVEYRTPSNFWMRSYQLMSLVMGLARQAVSIVQNRNYKFATELKSKVKMKDIVKAINENDAVLAKKNWIKIRPFLKKRTPINQDFALTSENIKDFEFFIRKGIDHWFSKDIMKNWTTSKGLTYGWENFLEKVVRPERIHQNA